MPQAIRATKELLDQELLVLPVLLVFKVLLDSRAQPVLKVLLVCLPGQAEQEQLVFKVQQDRKEIKVLLVQDLQVLLEILVLLALKVQLD